MGDIWYLTWRSDEKSGDHGDITEIYDIIYIYIYTVYGGIYHHDIWNMFNRRYNQEK